MRDYEPLHQLARKLVDVYGADFAVTLFEWIAADQLAGEAAAVVAAPPAPPVYEIPAPPLVGSLLTDRELRGWRVTLDNGYTGSGQVPRIVERWERIDPADRSTAADLLAELPDTMPWWQAVVELGPLHPVEQDPDDARLYGPIGQRWGDPDRPCWFGFGVDGARPCMLGENHTGPHRDQAGAELPPLARLTVNELGADLTPCTCGHPEQHRPECPRSVNAGAA